MMLDASPGRETGLGSGVRFWTAIGSAPLSQPDNPQRRRKAWRAGPISVVRKRAADDFSRAAQHVASPRLPRLSSLHRGRSSVAIYRPNHTGARVAGSTRPWPHGRGERCGHGRPAQWNSSCIDRSRLGPRHQERRLIEPHGVGRRIRGTRRATGNTAGCDAARTPPGRPRPASHRTCPSRSDGGPGAHRFNRAAPG